MVGFPTIRCSGEHATNDGAYHKGPPNLYELEQNPTGPRERPDDEPRTVLG